MSTAFFKKILPRVADGGDPWEGLFDRAARDPFDNMLLHTEEKDEERNDPKD